MAHVDLQTLLYDGAGSRALDARAREALNISGFALMQRAASAALDVLTQRFPEARRVSVWCGKGNNAGDAYLLAVLAHNMGLEPTLVCATPAAELTGDAAEAARLAKAAGLVERPAGEVLEAPLCADVIVDGLLGTGLRDAPRPLWQQAIDAINASGLPVLSLDVPSGVDAGTGAVPGRAIQATVTVTFIGHKAGLHTGIGRIQAGDVVFADLGVPVQAHEGAVASLLHWSAGRLPRLADNAYKHQQGHVLVVGGDAGMPGAVALAGTAALRSGAGMVTVATHAEHASAIIAHTPELMVLDARDEARLQSKIDSADCLVIGPGLGRSAWSEAVWRCCQPFASQKVVVIDADGLFWLARDRSAPDGSAPHTASHASSPALWCAMTPHTGEAATLLETDAAHIERDRLGAAAALAASYDAATVLKGPGSVVHTSAGVQICAHGNPGMATAGMGDVLSGITGALLAGAVRECAGGVEADLCAERFATAVALHSAAADAAAAHRGRRGLIASDVIEAVSSLLREVDA